MRSRPRVAFRLPSILRHLRLHFPRPGVDAAGEAGRGRETSGAQEPGGAQAAGPVVAIGHDLGARWQLTNALGELAQRNQHRSLEVRDAMLPRLAHVEQLVALLKGSR